MNKERAIERLKKQIQEISEVRTQQSFSSAFKKWERDTEIAIEKIFGDNARHIKDFKNIHYSLSIVTSSTTDYAFEKAFLKGLEDAKSILQSFIDELEGYWEEGSGELEGKPLDIVRKICLRFHTVAR